MFNDRQPTNLWEIFSPKQERSLYRRTGLFLGGCVLSLGASVLIPHPRQPGWSLHSVGRFGLYNLAAVLGGCAMASSIKLWQSEDYSIASEKAKIITWNNAMGFVVQAQQEIDQAYYLAPHLQPVAPSNSAALLPGEPAIDSALPPNELHYPPLPMGAMPQFDVHAILEEATGIGLLGNSGSGKTSVAKLLAGSVGDSQILVLDPHDDPDDSEWKGLYVIRHFEQIVQQLQLLLELLDKRDKTPLVILCDEWPAVRAWCKRRKLTIADDFLLRYGSEARKFNKLPIFCSQSGNTKALGLEGMGDFLENFLLIRLHRVARKYARNLPDQTILQRLNAVAYPCLVGEESVIHPTHGHHNRFYKGATPKGLLPLRSLPLTIPLVVDTRGSIHLSRPPTNDENREALERLWKLEFDVGGSERKFSSDEDSSAAEVEEAQAEGEGETSLQDEEEEGGSGRGSGSDDELARIWELASKGIDITNAIRLVTGVKGGRKFQKLRSAYKSKYGV